MTQYKLSAVLAAHEDDVRDVTFPSPSTIISASRDATVRVWNLKSSSPPIFDDSIASHGSAFVNTVTFALPSPQFPDGLIVSAGKDTIIDVRQPGRNPEADPERLLLGHQGNVCALDVSRDLKHPYLVSGSWDCSARIWDIDKGECTAELQGHQASVWAVLAYDASRVITGCADHLIRVFAPTGKLLQTIKGSTDVVRALCRLPHQHSSAAHFASAGNDALIRLWTLEGKQLAQLSGHENFVYSLASLPTGELVSASEDRTVRIWDGVFCMQTITHPAISVWCVAVCAENGDIVSGASDRIARVFSRSPERHASPELVKAFEDSVKSSSIPQQAMGDIKKEKLPGPDFLQQKSGTKEGQVQMIREGNGSVTAYQWSDSTREWIQIGTVVDAQGSSGRKREYMGQDYDYVFDVDIKDGAPPLKLPFNLSQNPYEVAQKWIADNELPTSYVDQVANFIITNTQGTTLTESSASQPNGAARSDPWGQESRYRPGDDVSAAAAPKPRPKIIPQKEYLTIATANFHLISKKIAEINQQLINDGRKDLSLSPGDLQVFPSLIKQLETTSSTFKPSATTSAELDAGIAIATKIAMTWPAQHRIPGLDLLRCLAASSSTIAKSDGFHASLVEALPADPSTGNANVAMLAIRALANMLASNRTASEYPPNLRFDAVHALVKPYVASTGAGNRNVHIAITTLYINYAVQFSETADDENQARAETLVRDLLALLTDAKVVDGETLYRALVALGTLLAVRGTGVHGVGPALDRALRDSKEPRIKSVCEEVRALLDLHQSS